MKVLTVAALISLLSSGSALADYVTNTGNVTIRGYGTVEFTGLPATSAGPNKPTADFVFDNPDHG